MMRQVSFSARCLLAPLTLAATLATASAAVVADLNDQSGAGPFDPYSASFSTTNNVLYGLTGAAVVSAGDFTLEGAGGVPALNDGVVGPIDTSKSVFATVGNGTGSGANAGTMVTFTLSMPVQLSSIVAYGGWVDSGRDEQNFDVLYSTDNGQTFTLLTTVSNKPATSQGLPSVVRTILTDDSGGALAEGAVITDLRFDFNWQNGKLGVENGWTGLTELAAYAVVPEPSAMALGLLGGLALLRRRRTA